jgi:hypothetical protein
MAARKAPASKPRSWTWRAAVVVAAGLAVGGSCGAGLVALVPASGVFAPDRARAALAKDDADALASAAALVDDAPDSAGIAALAELLLTLEHGAPAARWQRAQQRMATASPSARTTPEALYARALLAGVDAGAGVVVDDRLTDDLAAAKASPWVSLARALRAPEAQRVGLVEQAAFGRDAPLHAQHLLARHLLRAGDVAGARAALRLLLARAPKHPGAAITAVIAGLAEPAVDDAKPQREKNQGAPRPGQRPTKASADEVRAAAVVDDANADDAALAAFVLAVVNDARGADVDADVNRALQQGATRSTRLAARAVARALLVGDKDGAAAVVDAAKHDDSVAYALLASRVRQLGGLPADELRALQKRPRTLVGAVASLPLGRVALADELWPGLLTPRFVDDVFAEGALARLANRPLAEARAALPVVEAVALSQRRLAVGDVTGAAAALDAVANSADADVALARAAVAARTGDKAAAAAAVDAALAAAPADPRVVLHAFAHALDADDVAAARRAATAWRGLGYKSDEAAALMATLEAKAGNLPGARAALAEARALGGDSPRVLRATVLAYRFADPAAARAAADALVAQNDVGGGDVVAAWRAEAQLRKGEMTEAETGLRAIVDAKRNVAEAHLFLAQSIQFNATLRKDAMREGMIALERIPGGPLVDEAKKLVLALKKKR